MCTLQPPLLQFYPHKSQMGRSLFLLHLYSTMDTVNTRATRGRMECSINLAAAAPPPIPSPKRHASNSHSHPPGRDIIFLPGGGGQLHPLPGGVQERPERNRWRRRPRSSDEPCASCRADLQDLYGTMWFGCREFQLEAIRSVVFLVASSLARSYQPTPIWFRKLQG